VPLHETTATALSGYAATRDRLCPRPRADVFFCSSIGTPLNRSGVDKTFRQITTTLGLRTATVRPRVHDLRHGFAVRTLINWQRQGVHIDGNLATLSGYLGHVAPLGHLLHEDPRQVELPEPARAEDGGPSGDEHEWTERHRGPAPRPAAGDEDQARDGAQEEGPER